MSCTEASVSPEHSFSETEKTEVDAESPETEHKGLATSCVTQQNVERPPLVSTGDGVDLLIEDGL